MPTETILSSFNKKKDRKTFKSSFYHSPEWRKLSRLHKIHFPLCSVPNCLKPVHTTDHITPIKKGGEMLSWANLQSLCKHHNAVKTAKDSQ